MKRTIFILSSLLCACMEVQADQEATLPISALDIGVRGIKDIVTHHIDGVVTCTYQRESLEAKMKTSSLPFLGPIDRFGLQWYSCKCDSYLESCMIREREQTKCPPGYIGAPYILQTNGSKFKLCPLMEQHYNTDFASEIIRGLSAQAGVPILWLEDDCELRCEPYHQQFSIEATTYCRDNSALPPSYSYEGGYECDTRVVVPE